MVDTERHRKAPPDRRVVEEWIARNPDAHARLSSFEEPGTGQEILVVNIPAREDLYRARQELLQLVSTPGNLRLRRWRPSAQEVDQIMRWALDTLLPVDGSGTPVTSVGPDPYSGLVMITLGEADPAYAAELEVATGGLAFVALEPDVPEAPVGPAKPAH